jgi:hypothetical protein
MNKHNHSWPTAACRYQKLKKSTSEVFPAAESINKLKKTFAK